MKTMTYIEALNIALTTMTNAEAIERVNALKEQLAKRNSADRKPTKVQQANEGLKDKLVAVMTSEGKTITELMAMDAELSALSNQKVSALANALVKEGRAVKIPDGRKTTFAVLG